MRFKSHKDKWWFDPQIKKPKIRIPKRLLNEDPMDPKVAWSLPPRSKVGAFQHSRKWVPYNRLQQIDAGYITPLYTLHAIGMRYGLSDAGERYFRKHILPEPFKIVRIRSVSAHHWSRFTLIALDVVMRDLESRGLHQFLSKYEEHIDLLHAGDAHLHDHYAHVFEAKAVESTDKFGVSWIET